MTKFELTFEVKKSDTSFEDGGQSVIVSPLFCEERGGDGFFFVRLHSWQDKAKRGDQTTHPFMRSLFGKRVKVTVEVVE
jgi:hypothetical protein